MIRRTALAVAAGLLLAAAGEAWGQTADAERWLNCVVERGDLVSKGEAIATLESGVEKAVVASAAARAESDVKVRSGRARLNFENRRMERGKALLRKKVMASSKMDESRRDRDLARLEVEESQFERRLARLELDRARQVLARRTTRSPIDGVVVDRFLSPGEYVRDQAPIARIARIDRLNVEVFVPVARYGTIVVGMPAEVRLQAPIGGRYRAKVTTVDRVLDAASGTFRARLDLPNPDLRLPAGIRCTVRFAADGKAPANTPPSNGGG